jgi:hypothetical protein
MLTEAILYLEDIDRTQLRALAIDASDEDISLSNTLIAIILASGATPTKDPAFPAAIPAT